MKRAMTFLALCALCVLALTAGPARAETPEISTRQLLDTIASAKGKVVVINFFAAFCPPCRKEIPGLIRIRDGFSPDDVIMIGVSVDPDREAMESFIAKNAFNYPVFHGNEELAYAFRVDAIPHNLVYDRQGKIVLNEPGYVPEGRLSAMLRQWMQAP